MSLEKSVTITDVQYHERTKSIYLTQNTAVYELEGEVRKLLSSVDERMSFSPLRKQEALDLGNNVVTAIVNEVFTDDLIAFFKRELPEGRTEEEMMELFG